ncbi:MAG TPA: Rieske (2Fe-2S) protein [Chloroflexota bacterium]|nr:Rieske (2Fe-2S) protein [Chloroflexota bacterium]
MATTVPVELDRLFGEPSWLDQVAVPVQRVVQNVFTSQGRTGLKIRNFLNGVWLGHPLHAAITDLPVGAFTTALALDYVSLLSGNRQVARFADLLTSIGLGGALAAAIAGLADFSEIENEQRRVGITHATLNGLAVAVYTASALRRRRVDRRGAIPLATLGYAALFVASDFGGRMVFHLGTLVNRQAWTQGPTQFTPVIAATGIGEGALRRVDVNGMGILLTRVNGQVYALGNTCTHWGCSLAEGRLEDTSIVCHCHGSQFDLRNGQVINGPASAPEISFDVRERDGQIEVRQRAY